MKRLLATIVCIPTGSACTTPVRPVDPEPTSKSIPSPIAVAAPEPANAVRSQAPDPVPTSAPTPSPDTGTPRERATGRQPRTLADALYVVTDVAGRIVGVPDANGDGLGDLVVARGPKRGVVRGIDLLSSKDGSIVRRLYECAADDAPAAWDAGGDVDGDGAPDLVLGFPRFADGAGRVLVISGATAAIVLELRGSAPNERFGTSVVFLGDVDGDGRGDFTVSATQVDAKVPLYDRPVASLESSMVDGVLTKRIQFRDGAWENEDAYVRRRLRSRSTGSGFASVRSGRDGAELWRVVGTDSGCAFGNSVSVVGDLDADRVNDVVVQCDPRSMQAPVLLSGASGKELGRLDGKSGPVGGLGDVDRDGIPDLFVDTLDDYRDSKQGQTRILSGRSRAKLFELPYPDWWTEYESTVGVGDLDGDGYADVALGDGNFNLLCESNPGGSPGCEVDVTRLTLAEAARLESQPWCAFTWESGCAIAYSGRTREPIFGVWAPPGSRGGLGLEVAPLPDVDGDGALDLIVADERNAHAFSGPGRAKVEARPR